MDLSEQIKFTGLLNISSYSSSRLVLLASQEPRQTKTFQKRITINGIKRYSESNEKATGCF